MTAGSIQEAPDTAPGDSIEDSRMTLGEHLDELRVRLIRATLVFVVAFVALYSQREWVLKFIEGPYVRAIQELNIDLTEIRRGQVEASEELAWGEYFRTPEMTRLTDAARIHESPSSSKAPGPFMVQIRACYWLSLFIVRCQVEASEELAWSKYFRSPEMVRLRDAARIDESPTSFKAPGPFMVKIRACFWLSLFVAGPIFLWEMWMFVAAGLYKAERKVVYAYFPVSLSLFLGGVAFGFSILVPAAIYFLQGDGLGFDNIQRTMELDQYMQFLRSFSLALGVVFQLPVFQVALSRLGLVDPATYAKFRGHMAIIALVVAAIITPPDPVTQILLAGPAILLWELGYWIARVAWKGERDPLDPDPEPAV